MLGSSLVVSPSFISQYGVFLGTDPSTFFFHQPATFSRIGTWPATWPICNLLLLGRLFNMFQPLLSQLGSYGSNFCVLKRVKSTGSVANSRAIPPINPP